jgi:hypothetical protein
MPVRDKNPWGGSDLPSDAKHEAPKDLHDPTEALVIKCPICGERTPEKIATQNTPSQILRKCKTCGNQWSCGNVGGAYEAPLGNPNPINAFVDDEELPPDPRLSGTERWFGDE